MSQANQNGKLAVAVNRQDHVRGSLKAKVTLVEYGDYRNLDCQASHHLIQSLQDKLGDCVCYVFRHFPQQSYARKVAEAAEAAHAQGQFWQMHQKLLEQCATLADADLVQCAIELNLDVIQFLRDMSSHCYARRIQEDTQSGRASGVQQTPTFFLNGTVHSSELEQLQSTIKSLCFLQQERIHDKV